MEGKIDILENTPNPEREILKQIYNHKVKRFCDFVELSISFLNQLNENYASADFTDIQIITKDDGRIGVRFNIKLKRTLPTCMVIDLDFDPLRESSVNTSCENRLDTSRYSSQLETDLKEPRVIKSFVETNLQWNHTESNTPQDLTSLNIKPLEGEVYKTIMLKDFLIRESVFNASFGFSTASETDE